MKSLPSGWSTVLANPMGANTYLTLIIGDDELELDDIISVSDIECAVDIDPEQIDSFTIKDIEVQVADPGMDFDIFTAGETRFPFAYKITTGASTTNPIPVVETDFQLYAGQTVTIADATQSEEFEIDSIGANGEIGYTSLANTYAAGAVISAFSYINKPAILYLNEDSCDPFPIFSGYIVEASKKSAVITLKLQNALSKPLNSNLVVISTSYQPTNIIKESATFVTTLEWNTGATTTLSAITAGTGAEIGEYTLNLVSGDGSYCTFTLLTPSGKEAVGRTDVNFSEYGIAIDAANWATEQVGDTLTFKISANFTGTVPEILYELFHDYAGITELDVYNNDPTDTGDLDYTFNAIYNIVSANSYNFSVTDSAKIIEVANRIAQHESIRIGQGIDGKIRLFMFHPSFSMQTRIPRILKKPEFSRSQFYNEINLEYKMNFESGVYNKMKKYPEIAENVIYNLYGILKPLSFKLPGLRDE